MSSRLELIIQRQFAKAVETPDEYIMYSMDPKNIRHWYILVRNIKGDKDEFTGGQYIFRMEVQDNFPYTPPRFYALTPNGFYEPNKICCISQGEYHASDYKATLGMRGFALELANGLMNHTGMGHGINLILDTTYDDKRKLARESIAYNKKYLSRELNLIIEAYAGYSAKWKSIPSNCTLESLLNPGKTDDMADLTTKVDSMKISSSSSSKSDNN